MMQPSSLGMPSPTTILAHFMSSMQQPMSDASVTRRAWNANGFNVYAGKFKHTKLKNEKSFTKEELPNEEKSNGADLVDQIKKKYGFYQSYETNSAKMAENKLKENQTKLQNLANLEQPCSFKRIMGMVVIIMLVWQV